MSFAHFLIWFYVFFFFVFFYCWVLRVLILGTSPFILGNFCIKCKTQIKVYFFVFFFCLLMFNNSTVFRKTKQNPKCSSSEQIYKLWYIHQWNVKQKWKNWRYMEQYRWDQIHDTEWERQIAEECIVHTLCMTPFIYGCKTYKTRYIKNMLTLSKKRMKKHRI